MSKKHRRSFKNRRVLLAFLYGDECFYCGIENAGTVDHVVPTARGGSNTLGNKVLACADCNNIKGDMLPEEFAIKYADRLRWDFDWQRDRRAEFDAFGIPCTCHVCESHFYGESILRYCGKICSTKAKEVHNALFRDSPIYARMIFDAGVKSFPRELYKEYA